MLMFVTPIGAKISGASIMFLAARVLINVWAYLKSLISSFVPVLVFLNFLVLRFGFEIIRF